MAKVFSNLPTDGGGRPIQTGNAFVLADITGTPKTSPLAIDTNVTTIAVPTNALEMVLSCDVAIRIGTAVAVTTYFTLGASTVLAIPVGTMDNIYIRTGSGSGTLQFYFITV